MISIAISLMAGGFVGICVMAIFFAAGGPREEGEKMKRGRPAGPDEEDQIPVEELDKLIGRYGDVAVRKAMLRILERDAFFAACERLNERQGGLPAGRQALVRYTADGIAVSKN